MQDFEIRNLFFSRKGTNWILYLLQGLLVMLTGIIILVYPEILVAFVAMLFFIAGFLLIAFAIHLRRRRYKFHEIKINY